MKSGNYENCVSSIIRGIAPVSRQSRRKNLSALFIELLPETYAWGWNRTNSNALLPL